MHSLLITHQGPTQGATLPRARRPGISTWHTSAIIHKLSGSLDCSRRANYLHSSSVWMAWGWMGLGSFKRDRSGPKLESTEKLKGYHQLAMDALETAYKLDTGGDVAKAKRVYTTAVEAMKDGIQLPVQHTGLGPLADSTSMWKRDMETWLAPAEARLRYLESCGQHVGGQPPPPFKPSQRNLALGAPSQSPATRQGSGQGSIVVNRAGSAAAQQQQQQQQQRQRTGSDAGGARLNARGSTPPGGGRAALVGGGSVPVGSGGGAASRDKEEERFRQMIMSEVLDHSPKVSWADIADLALAKQALQEAVILPSLRPDLFTGPLRAPIRGILLYGPPGNGKTMLGKALAHEARARFFAISASSLTSKWVGEGEKLVRTLFAVAAEQAPSVIFIDEIDSILGARGGSNEGDAARRLKTEFLVQFDGVASNNNDRVVVIGATNRPHDIDDAVRRRLVKRIYIPLPNAEGRTAIMQHLLKGQPHRLSDADLRNLIRATEGYSASDLTALCKEAAMAPVRELPPSQLASIPANSLRPIKISDFATALRVIKPSVNREMLRLYDEFTRDFGTSA